MNPGVVIPAFEQIKTLLSNTRRSIIGQDAVIERLSARQPPCRWINKLEL
jgi:hypothetical protein